MRRFTQGLYGYAVALFVCLAGAGLFLLVAPQSREEHIPRLDYSITVANFGHTVPFGVWAPRQDPPGWVPNSNRIAKGEGGAQVLYLGYATAKREHAMFAQSNEQPAAGFANRMTNTDKTQGTRQIGGATWEQRYREDKKQRSLVRVLPDVTLVITGTADWPELEQLATQLQQRPKG
ncbi:hypothetical protein BKM31_51405 [[Actinomadura] parvosata subsp. kistnae]|uniref:DUF4245 domain-containing protein n=2 Tax=Nonomuraea TaxID=83681 RepID=A0A1V0AF00_9ACTN|nr:DUF4245 domain-containing protein [Nonomuraea sp. ATCC 55076]AQZ68775.1 hypothetical protein BKM31_51405 [Nonomuraea sp. ATCC 55076]NJP89777.1 DUF4245 domain-containing protein [Nonomuraea sp. FMUSA5-5]